MARAIVIEKNLPTRLDERQGNKMGKKTIKFLIAFGIIGIIISALLHNWTYLVYKVVMISILLNYLDTITELERTRE